MRRKIIFGSIHLETDGFERSQYAPLFDVENLCIGSAHPQNWHAGKLKQLLRATRTGAKEIPEDFKKLLIIGENTAMSEEDIEKINSHFDKEFGQMKEGYSDSIGFFADFMSAIDYCQRQERMGINPVSGLIHSMIFIRGEGNTLIRSKGGREYEIKADIWIEGYKHDFTTSLTLAVHGEILKAGYKSFVKFLMKHDWTKSGFAVVPQMVVTREKGISRESVEWYDIEHSVLKVSMRQINIDFVRHHIYGNPGNMEEFIQKYIDELDEFFSNKQ